MKNLRGLFAFKRHGPSEPSLLSLSAIAVRFCSFTVPTNPGPIRSNPKLRAETCAAGPAGVENPNGNSGFNSRCNTCLKTPNRCTVLQCVAACCTVLHAKIFLLYEIPEHSSSEIPRFISRNGIPPRNYWESLIPSSKTAVFRGFPQLPAVRRVIHCVLQPLCAMVCHCGHKAKGCL
jgi:hypothetical protein